MLGKISALTCSDSHVYAGFFDGSILRWPLSHIANEIAKPLPVNQLQQDPEDDFPRSDGDAGSSSEDDDLVERVPLIAASECLPRAGIDSVNQLACLPLKQELLAGHKSALSLFDLEDKICHTLILQGTLGFVTLSDDDFVVQLTSTSLNVVGLAEKKVCGQIQIAQGTCVAKRSEASVAIGCENSKIYVYSINPQRGEILLDFVIDN